MGDRNIEGRCNKCNALMPEGEELCEMCAEPNSILQVEDAFTGTGIFALSTDNEARAYYVSISHLNDNFSIEKMDDGSARLLVNGEEISIQEFMERVVQ